MRKKIIIIIIFILLISGAAGISACYLLPQNLSVISRSLGTDDGTYSLSVPFLWKNVTPDSQRDSIEAENSSGDMYARLSFSSSADRNYTIEDYVYEYINEIAENSDDPIVQVISVTPYRVTLGDNIGYYFELDSVADGLSLHLWDFVFEDNGGYVHVDVAAAGEETSESANTAKAIISSAKVKSSGR